VTKENGDSEIKNRFLKKIPFENVGLQSMMEELHRILWAEKIPCVVTVFLPSKSKTNRNLKAWELDPVTTKMIKNNLPEALFRWGIGSCPEKKEEQHANA
jgi:hypothetical protein